jgi:arylsulfatase A-like enzyme
MRSCRRGLALVVAAAAVALPAPAASAQQPNIVFVMTDDQTYPSASVQPRVQALGRQGSTFERAYVTFPLCCPSRATYLSGQYSHNHGVVHNAGPHGGYQRFDHSNALPLWLQAAGYRTMHVGRYFNGYGTQNLDLAEYPPGWDDWVSQVGPTIFEYERWQTNENGQVLWRPGADRPNEHRTDFMGRRAAELVDAAAPSNQPFFLSLTLTAPHLGRPFDDDDPVGVLGTPSPTPRHQDAFEDTPLPRPPNFDEVDVSDKPQIVADRPPLSPALQAAIEENYQQELEALLDVDDAVGRVLAALRRHGELANTLIVYTSDNGFFHGEHRLASEKVLPYEAGAHVPLIVRGPGVPRNRRYEQLVGNIDIAPTIVQAAGARPWRRMDGRSLFELFQDPRLVTGRELVHENGQGANGVAAYRGLRNDRYLWVEHKRTGEYELYDLRRDPYELDNLAYLDAYAEIADAMARRLRRLQRCRGASACSASRPTLRVAARGLGRRAARGRARRGAGRSPRARSARLCASRDLRVALGGRDADEVQRVTWYRRAKRLRATRRPPFAARVKRRLLRGGRRTPLRALVETVDGRRATYDRAIRNCPRRAAPRRGAARS